MNLNGPIADLPRCSAKSEAFPQGKAPSLVPSTRIERVTYPLGKGRSIQLSYEGLFL